MSDFDIRNYEPSDTLYLWWLGNPRRPRLVGELGLVRLIKGVSLVYDDSWLANGFALSEDLPLVKKVFLPVEKNTAVGAVDDARPDRWGEHVIRVVDKPPRLAILDYLFYAGDDRFGALGVSVSPTAYVCRSTGVLPVLANAQEIEQLILKVLAGEPIEEHKRRLILPGSSLGGARPKALISNNGTQSILKFNEPGEFNDMSLIEHATMTLAVKANIRVASTSVVKVNAGHALLIKRFDREKGLRLHAISANVALKSAEQTFGYPELAQWLRRFGLSKDALNRTQMKELFRRMVFNILIDNTDDHEKNHALIANEQGEFALSPAFDLLPSGQALGFQQMRVGLQGADSTIANALSACNQFGLTQVEATEEVKLVCRVVNSWQKHFIKMGITGQDLAQLSAQIDRPFLKQQRQAWV